MAIWLFQSFLAASQLWTPVQEPGNAVGFKTIDVVKARINANPDTRALLTDFERGGGKLASGNVPPTGAGFEPKTNTIALDPKRLPNLDVATAALLFELIRHKHGKEHHAIDQRAEEGTIGNAEYATECERATYTYMTEHAKLAREAIENGGWPEATDLYGTLLRAGGQLDTFDKYLLQAKASPKPVSHYRALELRCEFIRVSNELKVKASKPSPKPDARRE